MISSDDDTVKTTPGLAGPGVEVAGWAARSSVGRVRAANEDAWGEINCATFAVADGMGGIEGGGRASALAIAAFLSMSSGAGWIHGLRSINRHVRSECAALGYAQAGTTLVGVIVHQRRCVTVHLGDSRIYRLRAGALDLLTADHNLANLRAAEGLSPEAIDERGSPRALTSYLGNADEDQRVDVATVALRPGDRLLLCTDGVHEQIAEADLVAGLAAPTCSEAVTALVDAADRAGGRDNATALVLEFQRRGETDSSGPLVGGGF